MAVIQTEKIGFGGKTFTRQIKCSADGVFSANLPDVVAEKLGLKRLGQTATVTGKTKDECLKAWTDAIAAYKSSNTTKRKIIAYELHFSAYIKDEQGRALINTSSGGAEHHKFGMWGTDAEGVALQLAAGVYEESCTTQPDGKKVYDYKLLDSTLPDSMVTEQPLNTSWQAQAKYIMDWTWEREKFFADVGRAMDSLILKLHAIAKDTQQLAKAIDTGKVPLLLAGPNQGAK